MTRSRCSVVRQQAPPYQDHTTDYHDWTANPNVCKFCLQTLAETLHPKPTYVELCKLPGYVETDQDINRPFEILDPG